MPTPTDTRMRSVALELIQRYGRPLTVTVPGKARVDLTSGAAQTLAPADYSVLGFLSSYSREEVSDTVRGREGAVLITDVKAFIAAKDLDFTPTTGLLVTLPEEGERFHVISALPYYSGEQVALWELQLRR